jgi:hypothetical protein
MKKVPKKEQFLLKQVKVKSGVVEFKATLEYADGQDVIRPELNDKYPVEPHPHMIEALNKLKRPLAKVHGLIDLELIVDQKDFAATPAQQIYAANHTQDKLAKVTITGVAISGEDKNRGIVITGIFDGQAINSKRLKFTGKKYGFEDELEEIVDEIEEEVFEFAFRGKKAQLDLAFEEEEKPSDDLPFDFKAAASGEKVEQE